MGKIIIIKGADFSANAVDTVNPLQEIDFSELELTPFYPNSSQNTWSNKGDSYLIPVSIGDTFIINGNGVNNAGYCLINLPEQPSQGASISYAEGETAHTVAQDDTNVEIEVPADCSYLCITNMVNNVSHLCGSLYKKIL